MLQVKTNRKDQQDRVDGPVATSLAHQPVVGGQAATGKKRTRGLSSTLENTTIPLTSLAQTANSSFPTALIAPQAQASSKNALHGQQLRRAYQKLDLAVSADTQQQMVSAPELQPNSVADAPPKAKKAKQASAISSFSNVKASPASIQDPSVEAVGNSSLAAAKGKQKKLGRNARLRLKRQAHRQQAQSTLGSQGQPASEVVLAKPPNEAVAARQEGLTAARPTNSPNAPGIAAQAVPGEAKQAAASTAKPGAGAVKQKQPHAAPAAPSVPSSEPTDSRPAGKLKKKGLLEQMRSKLFGGRFRMLNEQLYIREGQHAFHMMQGQPELYQQYHEVCLYFACLPATVRLLVTNLAGACRS